MKSAMTSAPPPVAIIAMRYPRTFTPEAAPTSEASADASEVGAASGVKVLGYRIAMIATGGGALVIADFISWQTVYLLMGVLMLMLAAVSTRVPEPVLRDRPPASMNEAVRMPLADFFARSGTARGTWILAFILLYRLG